MTRQKAKESYHHILQEPPVSPVKKNVKVKTDPSKNGFSDVQVQTDPNYVHTGVQFELFSVAL